MSKQTKMKPCATLDEKSADFGSLSISQLVALTGRHHRTIKKRIDGVKPINAGSTNARYKPETVLPLIYEVDLSGSRERTRLIKAQADIASIKLQDLKKEFVRADIAGPMINASFASCRDRLSEIPSEVTPRLIGAASVALIEDELRKVIYKALDELKDGTYVAAT
jgi:phage terminase Nu1 subunit (DNA packaging protein)